MNPEESRVRFDDAQDMNSQSQYYQNNQDQTFVSQPGVNQIWKAFDFLFPAGKLAKLVRVYDVLNKDFPWGDVLYKLKLTEGYPVINLIGAKDAGRGKFLAGIARAAFNCDAIIIDSAITTGIEKYTLRRGVKLFGVAPESEIKFPKINPTYVDPLEVSNGHSHLFLLNDADRQFVWGQEVWFKTILAKKTAEGTGPKGSKRTDGKQRCKIVHVFLGDSPHYYDELRLAIQDKTPIIIVKGSKLCNTIIKQYGPQEDVQDNQQQQGGDQDQNNQNKPQEEEVELSEELTQLLQNPEAHFFYLNSEDSEDIAQYLHFLLTVTPYDDGFEKRKPKIDNEGNIIEEQQQQQQQQPGYDDQQQNGGGDQDYN